MGRNYLDGVLMKAEDMMAIEHLFGEEDADAWVVVDQIGTMIAGPFGTLEAAEKAAELHWPDMPWECLPVTM